MQYEAGVEIDLGKQFPKANCGEDSSVDEIENSLLWSDDILRIDVYDLLGHSIYSTNQRDEYLKFAKEWNRVHIIKIHFEKFSKVELRK